ncbi:hypothetical protein [Saccharomonospora piscinae]|uniref:hypothetical protein n=1 Tax=Saccharomonospora piscinae TaxID=687388 RepID=UPI0004678D9A|nr:hypothetical protein [Saccharomonospora piscinae]
MDERRFEQLMHDAVGEPPEASFDVEDVTAASRRATARRRSLGAGVAAVVVLAGALVGVAVGGTGPSEPTTALGPGETTDSGQVLGKTPESGQPGGGDEREHSTPGQPGAQNFPDGSTKQGGEPTGEDGPRAGSTSGCETVDRGLATALAGELPIDPAGEAVPSPYCVAGGSAAAFPLSEGAVSVLLVPRDQVARPDLPTGSAVSAPDAGTLPDGRTVTVVTTPGETGGTASLAGAVDGLARSVAETVAR